VEAAIDDSFRNHPLSADARAIQEPAGHQESDDDSALHAPQSSGGNAIRLLEAAASGEVEKYWNERTAVR
jgi:hypothetical protein